MLSFSVSRTFLENCSFATGVSSIVSHNKGKGRGLRQSRNMNRRLLDKWKSLINFPGTLLFEESVIRVNIYHVSRLPTFGIQQESERILREKNHVHRNKNN